MKIEQRGRDGVTPETIPAPAVPSAEAVARAYDAPAAVARVASDIDPKRFADWINLVMAPNRIAQIRSLVGLKGFDRIDARAVRQLVKRLSTTGPMQTRILDVLGDDSAFGDLLAPSQWVQVLHSDASDIAPQDSSRPGLARLHALTRTDPGHPEDLLALVDGVRRGGSGAAFALALLATSDERAATAYLELARDYPVLPPQIPSRERLHRVLTEVLGLDQHVPSHATETAQIMEGDLHGNKMGEATVSGDRVLAQNAPQTVSPSKAEGRVAALAADTDDLDQAEGLLAERWDEASAAAADLSGYLNAGLVPPAPAQAEMLARFVTQLGQVASALDATSRDELRTAIGALRRSSIDPARKWLLRLVAMEGPSSLAASIDGVAAIAEEAAMLPEHYRDSALLALLTLIDLAAQRAAGLDEDWQVQATAQQTAAVGLSEHLALVFAAGVGQISVPSAVMDESSGEDQPPNSERLDRVAEIREQRSDVPPKGVEDDADQQIPDFPMELSGAGNDLRGTEDFAEDSDPTDGQRAAQHDHVSQCIGPNAADDEAGEVATISPPGAEDEPEPTAKPIPEVASPEPRGAVAQSTSIKASAIHGGEQNQASGEAEPGGPPTGSRNTEQTARRQGRCSRSPTWSSSTEKVSLSSLLKHMVLILR